MTDTRDLIWADRPAPETGDGLVFFEDGQTVKPDLSAAHIDYYIRRGAPFFFGERVAGGDGTALRFEPHCIVILEERHWEHLRRWMTKDPFGLEPPDTEPEHLRDWEKRRRQQ